MIWVINYCRQSSIVLFYHMYRVAKTIRLIYGNKNSLNSVISGYFDSISIAITQLYYSPRDCNSIHINTNLIFQIYLSQTLSKFKRNKTYPYFEILNLLKSCRKWIFNLLYACIELTTTIENLKTVIDNRSCIFPRKCYFH